MKHIVLAITGASGACYATSLAGQLAGCGHKVHLIVSPMGRRLLQDECGIDEPSGLLGETSPLLVEHAYADLADLLASGSVATDGMVVCPASVNTIAALAAGLCDNLITRCAFVHLKERRKLVLVPRETPTTAIDLENQARLAGAGAIVLPASPGFYAKPSTIQDLVDFLVARILDALGIEHPLGQRYGKLE